MTAPARESRESAAPSNAPLPDHRSLHVLALCVVAVAAVAALTSFRSMPALNPSRAPRESAHSQLPRAPTYTDLQHRTSPNRLRHPASLATMAHDRPARTDPVTLDDAAWELAVAARAQRRAYDGAPPTIPHSIAQEAYPNCLTCHADGLRIATRTAPAICHDVHASCTQCHVVSDRPMPGVAASGGPPFETDFAGLVPPRHGERAWPAAPPTIPHATLMRTRCDSCHGVLGTGIRVSHPWRESCEQCHAPSAAMDQRTASLSTRSLTP